MKRYIAAIDIGTSGCKSIIVEDGGAVVAAATEEYPLYSPRAGWNEQNPEDWWTGACDSMKKAIQKSGIKKEEIVAVSLSGQMHGLVAMDENKQVIRRAILWNDQRCEKQCEDAIAKVGGLEKLLECTNNNLLPGYQGGKILWLREQEPHHFERMKQALLPKDYIRFRLSGDYVTDVSDASGTGFFDVKKRDWAYQLIDLLGLPRWIFPTAVESDVVTGTVHQEAAEQTGLAVGTPVVAGGGDSVIQTTGMGLIKEGVLGITIGTGGIVAMGMSQYLQNKQGTLQFFCNNKSDLYHVMGVMLAAGGSYQWYRNTLCKDEQLQASKTGVDVYELLNEQAAQSQPGAGRLIYLPYLSGERCPYSDPYLRAGFIGLTQAHNKGDMTRAVMEGISYGMKQIGTSITKMKQMKLDRIIVSGGGSRSDLWRQMISDIFQTPVYTVIGASEGGAYGACMVGGVAGGLWGNLDEICGALAVETENLPNPKNKAIYEEMYSVYDEAVPAMRQWMYRLAQK